MWSKYETCITYPIETLRISPRYNTVTFIDSYTHIQSYYCTSWHFIYLAPSDNPFLQSKTLTVLGRDFSLHLHQKHRAVSGRGPLASLSRGERQRPPQRIAPMPR